MVHISVVIITLNEERNLARCLDSVKNVADEIVVVDSFSTDNTIAIAHNYNAKTITQAFLGYGEQKNFATGQATYDWILSLDADEALSPQLEKSILAIKQGPEHNAYQMARLTNYCGKWIKHCGWYPDKKIRFFNRGQGAWSAKKIHEYWSLDNQKEEVGLIQGDLLHYSYYSISDHIKLIEKYTEIAARDAVEKGKDCNLIKLYFGPKWKFFTSFIIKVGILDGYYGYIIGKMTAYGAFIKYSKIRQYAKASRRQP